MLAQFWQEIFNPSDNIYIWFLATFFFLAKFDLTPVVCKSTFHANPNQIQIQLDCSNSNPNQIQN